MSKDIPDEKNQPDPIDGLILMSISSTVLDIAQLMEREKGIISAHHFGIVMEIKNKPQNDIKQANRTVMLLSNK